MSVIATYVDTDTFTVVGDLTSSFHVGRRVRCSCGVDGYKYGTIDSSSYSDPDTTVGLTAGSDNLTSNLTAAEFGIAGKGSTQSVPVHTHADGEGEGGTLSGTIDHGLLNGLADDDHTQYHNDTRGDARYYTETELDAGQLDNRYYREAEVDTISGNLSSEIDSDISTHSSSADHDGRYYTEAEVDALTWTESDITDLDKYTQSEVDTISGTLRTDIGTKLTDVVEDTTPQLGGDLDINDKYIELDPAPASDHTGNGLDATVTVDGNSLGFGAALYMASDGNYEEAFATSTATMPCRVLALETGTGSKKVLHTGYIRDDSWDWTPGLDVYVSTTSGTLTQTVVSGTGEQVQIVGYALSADTMFFDPNYGMVEI